MRGHGEKLSRKQEQAIAALLTAPTLAEAATAAGIGQATLHRWLQADAFQQAYGQARRAAVSQAIARVQQVAGGAVETLRAVMRDPTLPASARVSAARAVLEFSIKGVEVEDLEARVTALEAILTKGGDR